MKKRSLKLLSVIIFSICTLNVLAGNTTFRAKLDSTTLLMGKVVGLQLELVQDKDRQGEILLHEGSVLTENVEIAELKVSDTTDLGNNRIQINRTYLLQSFDSGLYTLPPILYKTGNDTLSTNKLSLKVLPVETDSLKNIHDYKTVVEPERKWYDFLPDFITDYWWIVLSGIVILAIALFVVYRIKKGKPLVMNILPKKKILPPYDEAMLALQSLKSKGLCHNGQEKEYYSEITDIIRHYIDRRFDVNAMEMTTSQIMSLLNTEEAANAKSELQEILNLADFVKFAKFRPDADANEQVYKLAKTFLEKTKPIETNAADDKGNNNKTNPAK